MTCKVSWSVLQPLLEMPDDVDAVPFHHVLLGVKFHEPSLPRTSYLPAYVLASSWAAERPTLVPMPAIAAVVAAWRRRIAMGSLTLDTAAAAAYPVTTDTVLLPGRLHVVTSQTVTCSCGGSCWPPLRPRGPLRSRPLCCGTA